jgi:hypothetical protein
MSLNNDGYFEDFVKNLNQFSMRKLCEIVVTDRYLGSFKREAIMCMEELAKRRAEGDLFDYEDFIDNQMKKLPEFKINLTTKMHIGYDLSVLRGIK